MDRARADTGNGGGVERLAALSDGVFAIAMTLLVLDVSVPAGLDSAGFHDALRQAVPNLAAYALSFVVIAKFWRDHRRILGAFARVDGPVTGLVLLGLSLVALLPFPTALLAEYSDQPLAVAIYSGAVAATNAVHLALLFTLHKRLRLSAVPEPITIRAWRLDAADLGAIVLVCGVAVPLAFVSPAAAKWFWLTLMPVNGTIGCRQRRAALELRKSA